MELTSRERIKSALTHIEPDRTPIFEYVLLSPIANEILGREYIDYAGDEKWLAFAEETGWEKAIKQYVIDRLDLACKLGHDMLYIVPNPLPHENGTFPSNTSEILSSDDPVERLIERNRKEEQSSIELKDDSFLVYYYLMDEMHKRSIDLPVLAPAYFHGIWTDADLMQTMILEPDVAKQHFSIVTKKALTWIHKYISIGIEQIGIGGDFAGNRLLISPESYKYYIVPEINKLSTRIHEAGCWAVNASDGNLWPVIDEFLLGCGVDGYLEIDSKAGMDMSKLKKMYGDRITLYGNMDCGNILSFSSVEEIRKYTIECIEAGSGNGGHIFCASNAITESIPVKNYLAMVNTYKEIFNLPILDL